MPTLPFIIDAELLLECKVAIIGCYRHVAPLAQTPTTYPCARRNPYKTNDIDQQELDLPTKKNDIRPQK